MKYIPMHKNIVADTLSRLEIEDTTNFTINTEELFGFNKEETFVKLPTNEFPLKMHTIAIHQQHDNNLMRAAKRHLYTFKNFSEGRKIHHLVCLNKNCYTFFITKTYYTMVSHLPLSSWSNQNRENNPSTFCLDYIWKYGQKCMPKMYAKNVQHVKEQNIY